MKSKKIYLAIPYAGMEEISFETANRKAADLMEAGHIVFSPISHSHPIAAQCGLPKDFEYWKAWNFAFIAWCEELYVVKLAGWENSIGLKAEIYEAMCIGKKVVYTDAKSYCVGENMKSLEEFNKERRQRAQISNDPHANGIGCPMCGKELWDSKPGVMLTSYPPQKNVHCPECGYTGYRIA